MKCIKATIISIYYRSLVLIQWKMKSLLKNILETYKYMTTVIFDFNHISPDLTIEQELELKSHYESCHLKCFLYKKKAFRYYKKIKYGSRFLSMLLTTAGIASVIATGGVLGILAAIPGIAIETLMD